jgi:hypothetical protein
LYHRYGWVFKSRIVVGGVILWASLAAVIGAISGAGAEEVEAILNV